MEQGWLIPEAKPERKREARNRAERIRWLMTVIDNVPSLENEGAHWTAICNYFIERGTAGLLTLNDRDGLYRQIPEFDEFAALTKADCRAMRRNREAWKPTPEGWRAWGVGSRYCTKLHPKEIKALRAIIGEFTEEIAQLQLEAISWAEELEQLRGVGPLPEEIAARFKLTINGHALTENSAILGH